MLQESATIRFALARRISNCKLQSTLSSEETSHFNKFFNSLKEIQTCSEATICYPKARLTGRLTFQLRDVGTIIHFLLNWKYMKKQFTQCSFNLKKSDH